MTLTSDRARKSQPQPQKVQQYILVERSWNPWRLLVDIRAILHQPKTT